MTRTISILATGVLLGLASPLVAQDYGAERQWIMEHPEALKALGEMPKEDAAAFLQTYQGLSSEEKAMVREHAAELQTLGSAERKWALANPDAVKQLGGLSEGERKKFLDAYKNLSDAEKQKLMENADELQKLSPEERKWALENPDAVKQLGALPDSDRDKMMDTYRNLSPDAQRMIRNGMGGGN